MAERKKEKLKKFIGRTLFVALGGTGGKTLEQLYGLLSPEERGLATMLYLDLDKRATEAMHTLGVKTVRISSAHTVGTLAAALGRRDGVYDWLPYGPSEQVFTGTELEKGAGQYRYLSRECLANFFSDPGNALNSILNELTRAGSALSRETLRVVIVSSVAGGTGAGTFIQTALYIRRFFREHNQNILITGIFALPDLFAQAVRDEEGREEQLESMYANAYAAIRELNAMNLSVSGDCVIQNNYGRNIRLRLDTRSEGQLFDSHDPLFTADFKTKPYDVIYFIDSANEEGGILRDPSSYYRTIADIAYTRLYSPLEAVIASNEINELDKHIRVPTAIYGSAGYARIRYPYESILRYLAERKTYEEVGMVWQELDRQWESYVEQMRSEGEQRGIHWTPAEGARGRQFTASIDTELGKGARSDFFFLQDMLRSPSGARFDAYWQAIEKSVHGFVNDTATAIDSGDYGAFNDPAVSTACSALLRIARHEGQGLLGNDADPIDVLTSMTKNAEQQWPLLQNALLGSLSAQANLLSFAIFPRQKEMEKRLPVSLHYSLLQKEGKNGQREDVHPLAARYLLYKLHNLILERTRNFDAKQTPEMTLTALLEQKGRSLKLAFDMTPEDDDDFTNTAMVEALENMRSAKKRGEAASQAVGEFSETLRSLLSSALASAGEYILCKALMDLRPGVEALIRQYEGFFESLDRYRAALERKVKTHERIHDHDYDQSIYVGASAYMKDWYYCVEPSVSAALEQGSAECHAAAGAGVYEALTERTRKALEEARVAERMRREYVPSDSYDGLDSIFDTIVDKYIRYLRDNAAYLRTDVAGAMFHQICAANQIAETEVASNPSARTRFLHGLGEMMEDLKKKALPMIRYSRDNLDSYYELEIDPRLENRADFEVSRRYCYMGVSPAVVRRLEEYFPLPQDDQSGEDPSGKELEERSFEEKVLEVFRAELKLVDFTVGSMVCDEGFDDNELVCFGVVHCLQPTQIFRFNESVRGSFYEAYRERVHRAALLNTLSMCPHLDKGWHLKSVMPFISRSLELDWRRRVMKAFLYEILNRKIRYKEDENGQTVFVYLGDAEERLITWGGNRPVLGVEISRLIEQLADDEARVEIDAARLDELVEKRITGLSRLRSSVAVYKGGMTRDELLRRLRMDAVSLYESSSETHGRNVRQFVQQLTEEEEKTALAIRQTLGFDKDESEGLTVANLRQTMGGILKIAYMVKLSEEGLDEDRDDAELLLREAADIIDRIAAAKNGERSRDRGSAFYREYVSIYNHAMDMAVKCYSEEECRRRRLTPEQMTFQQGGDDLLELPVDTDGYDRSICDQIRNTDEFRWIRANWPLKA